jgi:plastocyanin
MSNIELTYSSSGFAPSDQPADPGDTITINNTSDDKIDVVFTCGSVTDPLTNITSPVNIPAHDSTWGDVRLEASSNTITFSANGHEATVEVGAAYYQIDANPESISPTTLAVNPRDVITFHNTSTVDSIELEVDSPTPEPFGPSIGTKIPLDPSASLPATVHRSASNTQVKITVKGSQGQTSTIDVGSGDTESY